MPRPHRMVTIKLRITAARPEGETTIERAIIPDAVLASIPTGTMTARVAASALRKIADQLDPEPATLDTAGSD